MATIIPVERKKIIKKAFDLKGQAQAWAAEQESLIYAKKYRDPRLAEMVSLQEALEKYREFEKITDPGILQVAGTLE
jgi:hypothetical protein